MGPLVKIKLKNHKLSQVWLIKQLKKKGHSITPEELSAFLSGKKQTPKAGMIISASWDILCEYEKAEEASN